MNLLAGFCLLTTTVAFANGLIFENDGDVLGENSQVAAFFDKNMSQMKKTYLKEKNVKWDAHSVEYVIDVLPKGEENKIGYFVAFDVGYLSYGKDMSIYVLNTTDTLSKKFDFCIKANEGLFLEKYGEDSLRLETSWSYDGFENDGETLVESFHPIRDVITYNQFKLNACVSEIDFLMEHYPNVDYGKFFPFCKEQRENGCVPAAFANLIYSYKLSGVADLTNGYSPDYIDEFFGALAGYTEENGTDTGKVCKAMNEYLNYIGKGDEYLAVLGSKDGIPFLSSFRRGGEGHMVVQIGSGESVYWWMFKTHWCVVLSWGPNYDEIDGTYERSGIYENSVYVVDAQYGVNSWNIVSRK